MRLRAQRLAVVASTAGMLAAFSLSAPPTALASDSTLDRTIRDDDVVESSGLARSTYARRLLWTHNDRGDGPRIFGVNWRGDTRAVVRLSGAAAVDWEDIASGPGHTLWVADIGDNARSRGYISVYRLVEPEVLGDGEQSATRFDFSYPDGPHDAETLMVDPRDGRLYVVTKHRDGGDVYRAPLDLRTDRRNSLTRVASAPPNVTGGSFAPDGRWFALGNYKYAYVYTGLGASPRRIEKPALRQSESVEVNRQGDALLVGSEGASSPVYRVAAP